MTGEQIRRATSLLRWRPRLTRAERQARARLGIPARYPERVTTGLRADQEEWLAASAATLWPDDEYVVIITHTRQEDQ